eukprot:5142567-Prymnesium_polylepis.1
MGDVLRSRTLLAALRVALRRAGRSVAMQLRVAVVAERAAAADVVVVVAHVCARWLCGRKVRRSKVRICGADAADDILEDAARLLAVGLQVARALRLVVDAAERRLKRRLERIGREVLVEEIPVRVDRQRDD